MGVKLSASTRRFLRQESAHTKNLPRKTVKLSKKKVLLYIKQGGHCEYCFNRFHIEHLTYDHIVRKRDGGTAAMSNLVLACPPCNSRRELPYNASPRVHARWVKWHTQYVLDFSI